MAKQTRTSRSGPKKDANASVAPSRIKATENTGPARAAASASTGKKTALTSNKPAASSSTSQKKKPGDNGLLPKVAVKPVKLSRSDKLRKTYLKPEELEEFRQMLVEKRQELIGDVNHLHSEALHQGSSGETNSESSMPIHMADIGSDTWEQELTMGLIVNEQSLIREIDEALERIEDKTYGICLATNRIISKSRLRAKPWAKYCIEYARQHELGLI